MKKAGGANSYLRLSTGETHLLLNGVCRYMESIAQNAC